MATVLKAQLAAQLAAERHNNDQLRTQVESLTTELKELREWYATALATINELKAAPAAPRAKPLVTRPVYEFDPTVRGDFARASALARDNNGIVRRAS